MQTVPPPETETRSWVLAALGVVALVTLLRVLVLAVTPLELFVDEAQYWLWGARPDFGYYSKPPLIGWVIRASTELGGSDAPFWVRLPAPLLHGATAMVLGAVGARLAGARVGFWSAALYATLPFTAVGSILISTDTIMAPFYAAAILFFLRVNATRHPRDAVLAGVFAGLAFLAKYPALFLIPSAALTALLVPGQRPGWRNAGLMALAFALVISPNIVWNLTHDLTTVEHTMDNIGWVRHGAGMQIGSLLSFWGAQLGVFGPITMAGLLIGLSRIAAPVPRLLAIFALPALLVVSVQAWLDKAYANWAVATYFAGTVLAALALSETWRRRALILNAALCLLVGLMAVLAPWPAWKGEALAKRYLGRVSMSQQILALAKAQGLPLHAENRDILADLYYTGRDSGVAIYAPMPKGRAMNYYEQNFPLPADYAGEVLTIRSQPIDCGQGEVAPVGVLNGTGTWKDSHWAAYRVPAECVHEKD